MLLTLFSGENEGLLFGVFGVVIIAFLLVDLGVFHKAHHKVSQREALLQTLFWVAVSVVYGFLIYFYGEGPQASMEFFSAYVTEKALSVDNIFVILLILRYFNVKEDYYHNILFWGILGAIVFRAIFIFVGAFLIAQFHWILYIFGAFLIYSGVKIFGEDDEPDLEPEKNPILKWAKKIFPFTDKPAEGKFWIKENGKRLFTSLFLVIILIESTDLIFAVDSIPAAFAISQNEFVIYTSNIFAVMGLRAMFFLLANVLDRFYLLQKGLSLVLIFIGAKMMLEMEIIQKGLGSLFGTDHIHIPIFLSFAVIMLVLAGSIIFSLIFPKKPEMVEAEVDA
ncbi:MAG: tellurium resistance protein TerC [Flammeovirgaceae bacterium]|nr:tellurium resistance protein TerC [Flammeovirgaceae bacterium]MBE62243.1 tellurium resistance protein TerC [Flammeovirgaceae bacterium]MBE63810.1 tellurium resistance protein TerC [Flammeovirgaceae bacterium]MBR09545.1 tellurium resistance protein TerC [Rickettsiales bacterium]HCX24935.1 tellurium resistance protein TerC [Cytophagales bacterium]|tara:strand:- start:408 stop:1418 length:1011 start_codon:yes stop_codon:yes gene_type:complete